MTEDPSPGSEPSPVRDEKQADPRKSRTVRFTDSEWEEVKAAADEHGLPAAEFVRDRILDLARNPPAAGSVTIPANLLPLIERTFRYTYMLAIRMRDDMTEGGRAKEMEKLVKDAGTLQDSPLSGALK